MAGTHDTRRAVLRAAHRHFRRMNAGHADWQFGQSLRIELNRARSTPAIMARIKQAIEALGK